MQPQKKPGNTAIALVEALNYDGRGVAHVDGKAVFIDGALPGERVRLQYGRKRRRHDTAQAVEILSASPDRVAQPACRYFGTCGGCSLQHLQPEAQVGAKAQVLRDALAHVGKVSAQHWLAPLRGPMWGYRRKARLGVRLVAKKGGVLVGFRERRRSFITPLADCKTLDPRFARLLPWLPALISALSCPARIPQIELAAGDEQVALAFRHLDPLTPRDHQLLREFGERQAIQVHLQPQGPASVHPLWPEQPALLAYRLPEHRVEILFSVTDFTQINQALNRLMVNQALALLDPRPGERVVDLFCGLGNFSLPLARRGAQVIAIDGDATLVAGAVRNAAHNALANVTFRQAELDGRDGALPWQDGADKLLLDPPRSGAMEVIKRLAPHKPARIVYVSCNAATLARDSEYLVHALGYRLVSAGVMDMFPQTSHLECMALFETD